MDAVEAELRRIFLCLALDLPAFVEQWRNVNGENLEVPPKGKENKKARDVMLEQRALVVGAEIRAMCGEHFDTPKIVNVVKLLSSLPNGDKRLQPAADGKGDFLMLYPPEKSCCNVVPGISLTAS